MTNPVSVGIFPEGTDKEKTFDRATAQVRRSVPVCWIRNPVHSEVRLQYHFKCHHIIYPVIPRKLQPPIMLLIAVRQSAGLSTITEQHIKSCNSCICIVLLPEIICSNWRGWRKGRGEHVHGLHSKTYVWMFCITKSRNYKCTFNSVGA